MWSASIWRECVNFGEEAMPNQWVRNPFSFPVMLKDGLSVGEEEALAELSSDMDLKQRMRDMSCVHLWLSVETEFPHLSSKAMKVLIPFTSTYLCEMRVFRTGIDKKQVPVKAAG